MPTGRLWRLNADPKVMEFMRRLGMTHDPADDFDHPRLAETSPLRRQVLYRLPSDGWLETLR
jgi:hypothetical protein